VYPLGDVQARNVATCQPATLSAMKGLFRTEKDAPLAILGADWGPRVGVFPDRADAV